MIGYYKRNREKINERRQERRKEAKEKGLGKQGKDRKEKAREDLRRNAREIKVRRSSCILTIFPGKIGIVFRYY